MDAEKLNKADLKFYIDTLNTPSDNFELGSVLASIKKNTKSDPSLIEPIKQHIKNDKFVLKRIPIQFSQVKYLAALALATVYKNLGIDEIVILEDVVSLYDEPVFDMNGAYPVVEGIHKKVDTSNMEFENDFYKICYRYDVLFDRGDFDDFKQSIEVIPRNYSGI